MNKKSTKERTKNLQREYLVAENKTREQTTAKYVDESYQWTGGFD